MRFKKRYLKLNVFGASLSEEEAKQLVLEAVFSFLGEENSGKAGIAVKSFDSEKSVLLVKCNLSYLEKVIAALALKRFFRGRDVALRLVKLSGSISKLSGKG
ncbi:MAG: Rpp14/Pop5 family protein [Candidatus Micrarchaeota archaeon]